MTTPKLSICILTYNRAKTLRETLESILPQVADNPEVEVVISDNASTDNTASVCRDFLSRYPMIRYCPNSKNVGFDGNIVACVEKARGEYMSFFSDDDLSPPGTFPAIVRHLEQSSPTIVRINERPFFHDNPRHLIPPVAPVEERTFQNGQDFFALVGLVGLISTLTIRTSDARQFLGRVVYGRGTAHLDISARVSLLCKGPFVYGGNLMALARCDYNPWYDRLTYGVMSVTRVYLELQQENLLSREDAWRWIRIQIRGYLPRCVINNRCRKEGIVPAAELHRLYGKDPLFYLCVYPLLLTPPPILRTIRFALRSIVRTVRRLRYALPLETRSPLKSMVKKTMSCVPLGNRLIRGYRYWIRRRYFARFKNPEEVFTAFYTENAWLDPESLSGPGSTSAYTENIRREIPPLLDKLNVRRLLDAPCGDYNWFRLMERPAQLEYIGGDIVGPLVESNQAKHGNSHTRFIKLDITKDALPSVDLWLCRDCLFHLSEELVFKALENFARTDVPWLLTSTHPRAEVNVDIPTGSFRPLNLQLPPYNLPAPEATMEDWIANYPYRHLALWSREGVASALKQSGHCLCNATAEDIHH